MLKPPVAGRHSRVGSLFPWTPPAADRCLGACVELTYKWIGLAHRWYQLYLNRRLAEYGLSGSQYLFLVYICRQPGLTQDKLPELVHLNKSNVTRALARLERQGYIRREPHPQDRRTTAIFPTPRAEAAYPRIMEIISGWDMSVTEPLSEEERRTLRELLKKVVAAAQAHSAEDDGSSA